MSDNKEKEVIQKRKTARDKHTKDSMREKISFTKTLTSIEDAEDRLIEMIDDDELTSAKVGAINALLGSKWKKMDRLLPVLKATEITGADGKDLLPNKITVVHE